MAARLSVNALGVAIGHWTDAAAATGCTVVLCPRGAVGAVAVRGGAPCARETEILAPTRGVAPRLVHGAVLAGGSVFGLAACDGVVRWLSERGIGLATGHACIPIVPALGLYDLGVGDPRRWPDAEAGRAACDNARREPPAEGRVGAGAGATVGKAAGMERCSRGGLGIARRALPGGGAVEAIIAVNAFGEVVDPGSGRILAGVRAMRGRGCEPIDRILAGHGSTPFGNTTIGVIVTDAALTREDATDLASQAHDGLARTIRPVHTRVDGDALIVLATGRRRARTAMGELIALQHAAVDAVGAAVLRAVAR
ncbi:P1 family peptidase [bacterium]|nr:P1 family peptidase [bacterium]